MVWFVEKLTGSIYWLVELCVPILQESAFTLSDAMLDLQSHFIKVITDSFVSMTKCASITSIISCDLMIYSSSTYHTEEFFVTSKSESTVVLSM